MTYTKQQIRSRQTRSKFGSGRAMSHREEERRQERIEQKEFNKAIKNINPSKTGLIAKLMKKFNRSR